MTNEEVNALIEMFMRGNVSWRSNETEALSMRFEFYDADGDRVPVEGDAPTVEALNKKVYADDFNAVNVNLQALKEIVEQQANIINQQREEIMGLKSWFEKLFSSKNNDEVDSLKRRIESLTATINASKDAVTNKQNEIDRLNGQLNDKQHEIDGLNDRIVEFRRRLDEDQTLLSDLNRRIGELRGTVTNLQSDLDAWDQLTQPYIELILALRDCPTFESILQENKVEGSNPEQLVAIVSAVGKTIDFAKSVQACALKLKKEDAQPMTDDEIKVYVAINKCYRKAWGVNFDVFVLPGGKKPVDSPFNKAPFDKNEAINMTNPNDKQSRFMTAVYVPLICSRNGNVYSKAQIKAGNL